MKSSIQTRSSRAFTLLEIMFALLLLGMVVAAVYSSWMIIVRGSKSGLDAAAMAQRSRMAMHTIENALTCTRAFGGDIEYYCFLAENGDDASLSFVARLPASFPRSGKFGDCSVRRVTFSLEPGSDSGRRLVLRQSPVLLEPDQDEMEHPVVLARRPSTSFGLFHMFASDHAFDSSVIESAMIAAAL
jgi:prepilin-type N-terminal cleavage/methylation domain-containing protein